MQKGDGIFTDAVMFFDNNTVVKEMLYPEFEAILDHVVGIPGFEEQQVRAVFVRINGQLQVVACVFFYIGFDCKGYADKTWNIPLSHLADSAGRGPDLGAGPIKLSCRSQCSVSWHQRSLWDPELESGFNTLKHIAQVVKRNRLGLMVDTFAQGNDQQQSNDNTQNGVDEKLIEQLQQKYREELRQRLEAQAQEHKLRIATMKSEALDHVEKLHANYRSKLAKLTESEQAVKQLFAEEKQKNQKLKNILEQQAEQFHQDREQFERSISHNQSIKDDELIELQKKYELELKASIDTATAELKERLDMREVELYYRDEQIGRLHEDIITLRKEKQQLIDGGGDRLLKKLVESGITFVAYHPGVDHITIALRDMAHYLESPLAYVAKKCSVSLELYQQWKAHHELPVCNHIMDDGTICAIPIPKVEHPSRFIPGESDCCAEHGDNSDMLADLIAVRGAS